MTTAYFSAFLPVTAALLAYGSARILRLPFRTGVLHLTTALALFGIACVSEKAGSFRWLGSSLESVDFNGLLLRGLLPLLLFAQAFSIDLEALVGQMLSTLTVAVCGTVFSSLSLAAVAKLAFHLVHRAVPWNEALLLGAILSASDPTFGRELLVYLGYSAKHQARLSADSVIGAALAGSLVIGLTARSITLAPGLAVFKAASVAVVGGLALGFLGAALVYRLAVGSPIHSRYLLLAFAFGGYPIANHLGFVAPLEAVAGGLLLRCLFAKNGKMHEALQSSKTFCNIFDVVLSATGLVLLGWAAIITSYTGGLVALGLGLAGACLAISILLVGLLEPFARSDPRGAGALATCPVRVLIPVALALSLPMQLGRSWIVPVVYVVALINTLLLGTAMKLLGSAQHPRRIRVASLT